MKRWAFALFAAELCAGSARVHAQSDDTLDRVLKIESQAEPCLTQAALRERVRHWLAPRVPAKGVTVVVDAGAVPPAFRVWRDGAVIAVRRFALLPSTCADRLDAMALPIALAIEQATDASAAAPETGAAVAPAATTAGNSAASADDSNSARAQSSTAAQSTADAPAQASATATAATAPEAARTGAAPDAPKPTPTVATDADANREAATAATATEPESDAPAEPEADADLSTDTPDSTGRWRLFAGGSLLFEALPHTVVAVEAGPELLLSRHLSVSLGALVTAQTQHELGSLRSQAQAFGGRALACASWPLAMFGFDACAGAIGGAVLVNTAGSDARQTLGWVAAMARAALRFPANGTFSLRLGLGGLLNIVRPRLLASGVEPRAAAPGLLGAETSLELLIALP